MRLELFGDEVENAHFFDPESQRSARGDEALPGAAPAPDVEVTIIPAREALFTEEGREAAKQAVRDAAERVNRPTSRVREVLDAVDAGMPFFGLEALLPGFHPGGLATLFDYLPDDLLVWEDGVAPIEEELASLETELEREHAAAVKREELSLPPTAHFLSPPDLEARLSALPRVRCHAVWLGASEPLRFAYGTTADLRAENRGRARRRGSAHAARPSP